MEHAIYLKLLRINSSLAYKNLLTTVNDFALMLTEFYEKKTG